MNNDSFIMLLTQSETEPRGRLDPYAYAMRPNGVRTGSQARSASLDTNQKLEWGTSYHSRRLSTLEPIPAGSITSQSITLEGALSGLSTTGRARARTVMHLTCESKLCWLSVGNTIARTSSFPDVATSGRSTNMRTELAFRQCSLNYHSCFNLIVSMPRHLIGVKECYPVAQRCLFPSHWRIHNLPYRLVTMCLSTVSPPTKHNGTVLYSSTVAGVILPMGTRRIASRKFLSEIATRWTAVNAPTMASRSNRSNITGSWVVNDVVTHRVTPFLALPGANAAGERAEDDYPVSGGAYPSIRGH